MRAFLAIPLPDALRRAAREAIDATGLARGGWRVVRQEGVHLTIRFLGEADPARAISLDAAWREAAAATGRLSLRVRGAGVFPGARRPRVLWIGIEDLSSNDALAGLAARVELAARAHGFAPELRPFAPHVTLARARDTACGIPSLERVGVLGEFVAGHLVRYRSDLGPGGARYTEDARFALEGGLAT